MIQNPNNFYNTYNARHLNPEQVANTFIYSKNYEKLIQTNHSIVLGARGCGKTTLMKMLTLPALHAWKNDKAKSITDNIEFFAVYISTDIYWDVKNKAYNSQLTSFPTFSEAISIFTVNINVFKALCETFKNILKLELQNNDEETEIELCKELVKAWKLSATIPKLEYVLDSLNKRYDEVNQLIQKVIFNCKSEKEIVYEDYFHLSFESSLELVIPIFERLYNIKNKKKWALCFDELEFAPIWLQNILFTSLRSRTQYLLYKLSSSPILPIALELSLKNAYSATPGNDVEMIKMWSSADNEDFSKALINSLLKKKNHTISLENFFGTNDLYNKAVDTYLEGSDFYSQMTELLEKDEAFREFLIDYEIDPQKPLPVNEGQKDTVFRKIKPIVYFRNYYIEYSKIFKGKRKTNKRSRKVSELYSGIEVLSKICDGNPRWTIGVINSILSRSKEKYASNEIQYSELLNAANRFENVIGNIPIGSTNNYTLTSMIDRIGKYFNKQLYGDVFYMDPKGSFIVNESKDEIPDTIVELLEKGTAQGAFILINSNEESFDFEIRNQRFRLSYLFSLLYQLPLRRYTTAKLSECIKGIEANPNQISLFS